MILVTSNNVTDGCSKHPEIKRYSGLLACGTGSGMVMCDVK